MHRSALLVLALLGAGCSGVPPMRHRIEASEEPYVVFVADAPDGRGDLYAMTPAGNTVVQLTFTLPAEWNPRLSPDGDVVAFLRSREEKDTAGTRVWLLNLLNGAERELALPDSSGVPSDVAWTGGGRAILVQTTTGVYRSEAPPATPNFEHVTAHGAPSAFGVRVGSPSFARVDRCPGSGELCVYPDSSEPAPLAQAARDAARWGEDSLAYIQGDELVVRPLGPGRSRRVRWRESLGNPRQVTVFVGGRRPAP